MKLSYRGTAVILAIVLCCAVGAAGQTGDATRNGEVDWLRIAPSDAGFYVELRDLAGIRRQFVKLGIWRTVRKLSERDALRSTTQPWHRKTEELLGLSPEAAISLLLGRRTALIATNSERWQDSVVLAQLADTSDLAPLLSRWGATRQPNEGVVRRYMLRGGILLAVLDRTLVLGPAGDPDGLWGRTVLLLAGRRGPSLAGRSEFAGLRSRLSRDYPGLLYVVSPEPNPAALRGCHRLLVGFLVEPWGIACELRGLLQTAEENVSCLNVSAIRSLPADSLMVWTDACDFRALADNAGTRLTKDRDPLIPLILGSLSTPGNDSESLLERLGPGYAIVVGSDRSASTADSRHVDLSIPAITALVEARGAEAHVQHLDHVLGFLAQLFTWRITQHDERTGRPPVGHLQCEDVELHHVEIGPALAQRTGLEFLKGIQPCWASLDDYLIVSTSTRHVREIVQAARGKAPRLDSRGGSKVLLPRATSYDEPIAEWFYLRGSAISMMWSSWLDYVLQEHPAAFERKWWQAWAAERLEQRARLGAALTKDKNHHGRAVVYEVHAGTPAADFLQVGDVIVGAAGRPMTTTRPAREVAARYQARGDACEFTLEIIRGGKSMKLKIPVEPMSRIDLSEFDPVAALAHLTTLSRPAEAITVWRYAVGPDRFDARIVIRWDLELAIGD